MQQRGWYMLASTFLAVAVALGRGKASEPCAPSCSTSPCAAPKEEEDPQARAGYPQNVSKCAAPSDTGSYVIYKVGGGCACTKCCGDAPCREDGVWGWDYQGCWFPRRVILGWWHGRKYQGGTEGYKTDGPHLPHPEKMKCPEKEKECPRCEKH
jgi:hypothetical protein